MKLLKVWKLDRFSVAPIVWGRCRFRGDTAEDMGYHIARIFNRMLLSDTSVSTYMHTLRFKMGQLILYS